MLEVFFYEQKSQFEDLHSNTKEIINLGDSKTGTDCSSFDKKLDQKFFPGSGREFMVKY